MAEEKSRSEKRYGGESKAAEHKPAPERKAEGGDMHADARKEMFKRHEKEHRDLHGQHRDTMRDMQKRHEQEMAQMNQQEAPPAAPDEGAPAAAEPEPAEA